VVNPLWNNVMYICKEQLIKVVQTICHLSHQKRAEVVGVIYNIISANQSIFSHGLTNMKSWLWNHNTRKCWFPSNILGCSSNIIRMWPTYQVSNRIAGSNWVTNQQLKWLFQVEPLFSIQDTGSGGSSNTVYDHARHTKPLT
jgi:hypothetical protein